MSGALRLQLPEPHLLLWEADVEPGGERRNPVALMRCLSTTKTKAHCNRNMSEHAVKKGIMVYAFGDDSKMIGLMKTS